LSLSHVDHLRQGALSLRPDAFVDGDVLAGDFEHKSRAAWPERQASDKPGGDKTLAGAGIDHRVQRLQHRGAVGNGG
jgi:hypothetical protein